MTDHSHAELAHKGDPSLDRLLFFSDGVFAIAITLLSIELHPPHNWDGSATMLWREGWPMFASFALSFLVIGIFWNAHRRLFRQMVRYTQGVFLLNLLLLAGIALMPFATSLMWRPTERPDGFFLYIGLVSAIGLTQGLTYGYAAFAADAILGTLFRPALRGPAPEVVGFLVHTLLRNHRPRHLRHRHADFPEPRFAPRGVLGERAGGAQAEDG